MNNKKLQQIKDKMDLSKKVYINKNIFRVALGILFILLVVVFVQNGFSQNIYIECSPEKKFCENPFYVCKNSGIIKPIYCDSIEKYSTPELENIEQLKGGEYIGTKPSHLLMNFNVYLFFIIIMALLANQIDYMVKKNEN